MRYRYNNVYDIVDNKKSDNISLQELEKIIKSLIPSFDDKPIKNEEKIDELENLVKLHSEQLDAYAKEKEELLNAIDDKFDEINDKVESLLNNKDNKNVELLMDELISFKEKQTLFNESICDKVDDRIDRINELIDFINSIKEQVDSLSNDAIIDKINEFTDKFKEINDRLDFIEGQLSRSDNTNVNEIVESINEEDSKESDSNLDFDEEIARLEELIREQRKENEEIATNLNDDSYNKDWLKEFEEMQISLEDDGIYEYDVDNMEEEDMKFEYYNGELPKTKIVKVRSNDSVRNYSNEEINSFIGEEARKLASREIDKLQSDSEVTQKAWLANNQRLNEMAAIIERQEEEIKRLTALNKSGEHSNDDIAAMIKMEALKLVRDEYEQRIQNLENGIGLTNDDKLAALQKQLEEEKLENLRLKALLNQEQPKSEPVIVNVTNASPEPIKVTPSPSISAQQRRKRKQKFFFEIKEHNTPKITKADINKELKK